MGQNPFQKLRTSVESARPDMTENISQKILF